MTHQSHDRVTNEFGSHPLTDIVTEQIDVIRQSFASVGHWMIDNVPPGDSREKAMQALKEAMLWSIEGVRCDTNSLAGPDLKG